MYLFLDNQAILEEALSPTVYQRALWWGDGIFSTLLVNERGEVCHFDQHYQSLMKQAQELEITYPSLSKEAVEQWLSLVHCRGQRMRLKLCLIPEEESQSPLWQGCRKGHWLGKLFPLSSIPPRLSIVTYPEPFYLPKQVKTLSYAPRLWLKKWAQKQGADDALCVDANGYLLELSTSNVFWEEGGLFYTPDYEKLPIYAGTFLRDKIERQPDRFKKVCIRRQDLPRNGRLYSCNSLTGAIPIQSLDGKCYST